MKRLKDYLLHMNPKSTTYQEIYEGKTIVVPIPLGNPPEYVYSNTYWREEIAFKIERTHKLALDKPTITICIPVKELKLTPADCKYTASEDYILRALKPYINELNEGITNRNRPDKENGKYYIYSPGGEVVKRNCVYFQAVGRRYYELAGSTAISDGGTYAISMPQSSKYNRPPEMCINIMIQVQLPEKKLRKSIQMLTRDLPDAVDRFILEFDGQKLYEAIELNKKQQELREWLRHSDYCGFVANGAILPRKGNSSLPAENAVPFKSPEQNEIEIYGIKGMGIKKGVTVVTGGGYSGKSTLLDAVSAGIYDHIQGDGREFVITDDTAIKISAEDGRSVKDVNLSPFIKWLPNGGDASHFRTEHASGSTSQAANIIEAVNFGAKLFLIDEDRSATNFMIRDDMMKELIRREPITPFTDRVRQLYNEAGISTILVVGGSGEYLSVADSVIMMDEFYAFSVTNQAKEIYKNVKNVDEISNEFDEDSGQNWFCERKLKTAKFSSYPKESEDAYSGTERLEISDMGFILIGDEKIDVRNLHNFISFAQITAVGYMLRYLEISNKEAVSDMKQIIDNLYDEIDEKGIDFVHSTFFNCERWLDMPRKCELLAVINRMRFIDFNGI